jgi:hypothetical protein
MMITSKGKSEIMMDLKEVVDNDDYSVHLIELL